MSEQKLVPELRFPEFEGEWEDKTLGDFMSFKNGINADKGQYGHGRKFINVLDIISDKPIYHDQIIGSVSVSDKEFEKNEVKYGDILFQRSSETREEAGQSNIYLDKDKTATFGGFVIRGRPTVKLNPMYFDSLLKTSKSRKEITTKSGGSTRFNVGQESLSSVSVILTTDLEEQQKIADFLSSVDAKLAKLSRKKALLENYKRGLMQQIFSQKLRFKQDDGSEFPEWKHLKANKLFKSCSNKNHKGELPILAATQDRGVVRRDSVDIDIKTSENSIMGYKIIEPGDFVISLRSFQGGIEYSSLLGISSPAYTVLKPIKSICDSFYKFYFKKEDFITRLAATVVGIRDGKQISYEAFSSLNLVYPSVPEQQKIADFLSSFDQKIDVVSKQIEQLEAFKKGLLQKLFV